MGKKSAGSILTLIAAILSVAGIVLYTMVLFKMPIVYVFLVVALVLEIFTIIGTKKQSGLTWGLPVLSAALMACAIVWAVNPMVNTIGYVIAGLNEMSTVTGLIFFLVSAVLSMVLNIVASFIA